MRPLAFISSWFRLILALQDTAVYKQLYFLVTAEQCSVPSAADSCKEHCPGWQCDASSDACTSSVETAKGVKTPFLKNLTASVNV